MRNTWETLQRRWRETSRAVEEERDHLSSRYGPEGWRHATRRERERLASLEIRESKAERACFSYLDDWSPRDWHFVVPVVWIRDELSDADTTTKQKLSVVPPPAYGYSQKDAERFAAALDRG